MRYNYMDSLRAALMIGGIFYHAALVYRVGASWAVRDPSEMYIFNYFIEFTSSFRMPTFFFVAGFFCCMTFMKRDLNENLRLRLLAFLIPFFSIAATVQPIQYYLKLKSSGVELDFIQFISSFMEKGAYIAHLWFLINLVVYYFLIWISLKVLNNLSSSTINGFNKIFTVSNFRIFKSKAVISIAFAMYCLPIAYIVSKIPIPNGISLSSIAKYFPFFMIGYFSFKNNNFYKELLKISWSDALFLIILFFMKKYLDESGIIGKIIGLTFFYNCALIVGMLVVSIFKEFFNGGGKFASCLSDSAYTIYLFHQIIIISISTLFLEYKVVDNHLLKYCFVVFITIIFTYSIHGIFVSRFSLLKLLFNGKKINDQIVPDSAARQQSSG